MESLLYLGGPIIGGSFGDSNDWRKYVESKMPPFIKVVSPMRGKENLAKVETILGPDEDFPLTSQKGITTRDRFDVGRSNMLLMNFIGAPRVSIGSVIELGWADAFRKPVLVVMEPDNIHQHLMVKEIAGFVVPELDQGIEIAVSILSCS